MMFDDYLWLFILRVFWQNHVDGNANIVLSFWKAVRLTKDNILGRFVSIIMIQIFIRPIAKLRHVRLLLLEFRRQSGNMSFLGSRARGSCFRKVITVIIFQSSWRKDWWQAKLVMIFCGNWEWPLTQLHPHAASFCSSLLHFFKVFFFRSEKCTNCCKNIYVY